MRNNMPKDEVLQVHGLKKHFPVTKGLIITRVMGWIKAVDGLDFTLYRGETFGLVGESGCGKTTTAKLILLLERPSAGSILFEGQDILSLKREELRNYRRSVQAVFQDPTSSLNPRLRVGEIVGEPILAVGTSPRSRIKDRVAEVLDQVGLKANNASFFPHEFSGGQRQRIAIARALASQPACIILDEPVSALDVSIRAQILNLLKDLQERFVCAYLMIAHDLASVRYMSTRIGVMYLGKLAEIADTEELYSKPLHPYTRALLSAALPSHPDSKRDEIILEGEVPSPLNPPSGCRFYSRCQFAKPFCFQVAPPLKEVGNNHQVACHLNL